MRREVIDLIFMLLLCADVDMMVISMFNYGQIPVY